MSLYISYKKSAHPESGKDEIRALISLLEDPDPFVQQKVKERLSEYSEHHVPLLDEIREEIRDTKIRTHVTEVIHDLTFPSFEQEFAELMELGMTSVPELEKAQLLLCRFDNPTLRTDLYRRQLDKLAARLEPSIRVELTPGEQLENFNSFFFEQEHFKGAEGEYVNSDSLFLHKVIQRRTGIPISLGLVMLFVADRLDFPLYGVNMPMHFLLKYESGNEVIYIDPYHIGQTVSMDQCSQFLQNSGITPSPSHFEKATEWDMLTRTVRNLMISFEKQKREKRARELKRLLTMVLHYTHR